MPEAGLCEQMRPDCDKMEMSESFSVCGCLFLGSNTLPAGTKIVKPNLIKISQVLSHVQETCPNKYSKFEKGDPRSKSERQQTSQGCAKPNKQSLDFQTLALA